MLVSIILPYDSLIYTDRTTLRNIDKNIWSGVLLTAFMARNVEQSYISARKFFHCLTIGCGPCKLMDQLNGQQVEVLGTHFNIFRYKDELPVKHATGLH
jgi:hypothetical protein